MSLYIKAAFNRMMNDPDRLECAYEEWVEEQDEDADTSWEAFQADCRAQYEQDLSDYAADNAAFA